MKVTTQEEGKVMGLLARESTIPEVVVPDSPAGLTTPKFTRLEGVSALNLCDRHPNTYAVVEISRADWKAPLSMCGNCARKHFGYEHTAHAVQENRQKGAVS
jgi:hypothetical protein